MNLHIIAVGTKMPKWVSQAWQDYAQRLPAEYSVHLKEVRPEARTTGKTVEQMMQAEAQRITAALPERCWLVILDEHGKDLRTTQLKDRLVHWREHTSDVAIVIGGPDGLDAALKAQAQEKIRLSSLTLPHPMVRIVLIEQLYRVWSLLVGHPYHRS
ncbi:MAG TPA: 23S rRNA (pseudouridine(1915)-N(3))-methyltransferase RlmH [Candidatus Paenalcaligenes intestinipullorum]|uniref:Ribosomal RNA large subunit methyltransferase H n=1 Tax=Candidatus Paenalcaligenes intestinipullorum TaxID=2838718 RepID=A0A9D2U8A4_9BURK|nr:23S rRNA (pseudouridine(1915)-N(3))-methyltransferase RlmH [Candidatus Paenalcaligenes intestinipullorum]